METGPVDWCTIESDPGVFTSLIKGWGVKDCQVEEIYSLEDQQLLESMGEIYGLVFLFKWVKQEPRECLTYYDHDLFFCNQVIQNACATQALLAIVLNNQDIDSGKELSEFKAFTRDFDPQMRGQALSNQELIKQVHNSFQRPEPFGYEGKQDTGGEKEDAYHFISYVPFKGKVYELDGLQSGPILVGSITEGKSWIDIAKQEINQRIQKYSAEEIMFNLLSVIKNKTTTAEEKIKQNNVEKLSLYKVMQEKNIALDQNQQEDFEQLKNQISEQDQNNQIVEEITDQEQAKNKLDQIGVAIQNQQLIIEEEKQKQEKYKVENIRRKHNYIPFILELLKMTAKKGKLNDLVANAKKKQEEKEKREEEKKKNKQ